MTLLLVDGSNIALRCAFGGDVDPERSTPVAIAMIERTAAELQATHCIVAFDSPGPSWRKLEYSAYKANRTRDTSPWIERASTSMGTRWRVEAVDGFEADDILATLALRSADRTPVRIFSGDSDLMALATHPRVTIVRPVTGARFQEFTAADVCAKYQIPTPALLSDYKAIVGETGDNIAGVPGVGPKRTAQLLRSFAGLEAIINAGAGGYSRAAEAVATHATTARVALRLATLRADVPLPPISPRSCEFPSRRDR